MLILSNPPHGLVDAKRAAPLLDLLPVELVLKTHYPIPEIWLSKDDAAAGEAAVVALRGAGLMVKAVPEAAIGALPPQTAVEAFTFADDGLDEPAGPARLAFDVVASVGHAQSGCWQVSP